MARSVESGPRESLPYNNILQDNSVDEPPPTSAPTIIVKAEPNETDNNVEDPPYEDSARDDTDEDTTTNQEYAGGADEQDYVVGEVVDSEWQRDKEVCPWIRFLSFPLLTLNSRHGG